VGPDLLSISIFFNALDKALACFMHGLTPVQGIGFRVLNLKVLADGPDFRANRLPYF
jgi:hypothetical protein